MTVLEAQQTILEKQKQLVEAQTQLATRVAQLEAGGEWTPNADEAIALYNDAGQKALDAVESFLNKFFAKLG